LILTQKLFIPAFFRQSGTAALSKKAGSTHPLKNKALQQNLWVDGDRTLSVSSPVF
jgi:hypothetical protein